MNSERKKKFRLWDFTMWRTHCQIKNRKNTCKWKNTWEEYCVKVYEIDLDCKFIRINISKENYDADYEIGRIQTFISKLRNKKSRELEKENEELKEKIIKDGEKKLEK